MIIVIITLFTEIRKIGLHKVSLQDLEWTRDTTQRLIGELKRRQQGNYIMFIRPSTYDVIDIYRLRQH